MPGVARKAGGRGPLLESREPAGLLPRGLIKCLQISRHPNVPATPCAQTVLGEMQIAE